MLTPDQVETVRAHADRTWAQPHCVVCRRTAWTITGPVMLAQSTPEVRGAPTAAMPCAALTCQHCGHVVLVSLHVAGVIA